MGGTVKGRVDCVVGSTATGNRDIFVNCKEFFDNLETAGYGAIIASQFGLGATGFGFTGAAGECGRNAFFVFEWAESTERPGGGAELGKVYTLVQWSDGIGANAFGQTPGDPGLRAGGTLDGVGFQTVFRLDGNSPWGGSTAADGTDSKSSPVWVPGASTMFLMDYGSTSPFGTHITNFESTLSPGVDVSTNVANRCHFLADEDNFLFLFDAGDNDTYGCYYAGLYTPLEYLTTSYPLVCYSNSISILYTTNVCGTKSSNGAYEGLLIGPDSTGPVGRCYRMDRYEDINVVAQQPNPLTSEFDETNIPVYWFDLLNLSFGWCGVIEFIRETFNCPPLETNAGFTRATFGGSASTNAVHLSVPWGGGVAPGTGVVIAGRDF